MVELITDHQALKGLRSSTNHNRRLTRWALFLQDFDFVVTYYNSNADGLSRQCWPVEEDAVESGATVSGGSITKGGGDVATRHK